MQYIQLMLVINWLSTADADVRLARRIKRDTVEKGRDIATVLDQVRYNLLQYLSFPAYIELLFNVFFFELLYLNSTQSL